MDMIVVILEPLEAVARIIHRSVKFSKLHLGLLHL